MGLHGTSLGPKLMNISTGAALNATSHTASFDTEWVGVGGAERVAFWIKADETAGTGTYDIDVEVSDDAGTTVFDMPNTFDSETKAQFTQLAADINVVRWWYLPATGADSNMQVRLEFIAASSPTYTFTVRYSLFYPS